MDTKIITVLNIIFFVVGSLTLGTSYLIDSDQASNIGTILLLIFALISFTQLLAKGTLFHTKQYFYPIIFFVFLSFAPPAMQLSYAPYLQTVGFFGVMIVYGMWFLKKETKTIIDILKLIFVESISLSFFIETNSFVSTNVFSNAIFIYYIAIVGYFYYNGIKTKEIMK